MKNVFRRPRRYLLYPVHDELLVFRITRCDPEPALRFARGAVAGAPACVEFSAWLAEHSADRFEFFVDSVDEVQQLDELPDLRARDRRALIAKRLRQSFRDSEFTRALDPSVAGAKRRQVLLCALRAGVTLSPWLDALIDSRARLEAVSTPALLSAQLGARIAPAASGLLISIHPTGIRQTLLREGKLQFSRLAPISMQPDSATVIAELARTMQYLLMAQRVSRDDVRDGRLVVWILDAGLRDPQALPARVAPESLPPIPLVRVPAAALGARTPSEAPGLGVWLGPGLRRRSDPGYAGARVLRFSRLARAQRVLMIGSLCLLGASLLAQLGVELAIAHQQSTSTPASATARAQRQNALLAAQLKRLPAEPAEMRAVVEAAGWLAMRQPDAAAILAAVSRMLDENPTIGLDELVWSIDRDGNGAPDQNEGRAVAGSPLLTAISVDPNARLAPDFGLLVRGSVPASMLKSDANHQVERFAAALTAACRCRAESIRLPYDPAPEHALNGDLKSLRADEPRGFELRIVWPGAASRAQPGSGGTR